MTHQFRSKWLWLVVLALMANACGLFSPILNSNDAYFYAVISKNMLLSHDWVNLMYGGHDWLDKPHFPFWAVALSFKLFGVSAFSYVLPGFLFHCLGAYFTYRLASELFNQETGIVAALIYATSLHLMLSALDVRAEAYLLGQIMAAVYYWWQYDKKAQLQSLLLGSLFTALALMTKGPFVVVTIFGGFVIMWCYQRRYLQLIHPKWLLAYGVSLLFILPELICLYLQFDAHPEKIMFGQTHVSGIKWFFWGSQFGRFFNDGPIVNAHGNPFFFIHTFLWAFLPWSVIFILAIYSFIRRFKSYAESDCAKLVFLQASFWLTFIMFSATKFQLDHYTNIIMPFAAIICANYMLTAHGILERRLAVVQRSLSYVILGLAIVIAVAILKLSWQVLIALLPLIFLVQFLRNPKKSILQQQLLMPSLAIIATLLVLVDVNMEAYTPYDSGYNIAKFLQTQPPLPIYSLEVNALINPLTFHANMPVSNVAAIPHDYPYYLAIESNSLSHLDNYNYETLASFSGIPMEKFIPSMLSHKNFEHSQIVTELVLVNGVR